MHIESVVRTHINNKMKHFSCTGQCDIGALKEELVWAIYKQFQCISNVMSVIPLMELKNKVVLSYIVCIATYMWSLISDDVICNCGILFLHCLTM